MFSTRQAILPHVDGEPDSMWNDDTTGRICAAAIQNFYQRGYHAATMRDIAVTVGIRAPSIYNHFPNKEELLHFVMTKTLNHLISNVETALAGCPDNPVQRLERLVQEHLRFHIMYAAEAAVVDTELRVLGEDHRASVVKLRDRYEALLRGVLQQGVDQGMLTEDDVRLSSIAILTMCTAVATWYRAEGSLSLAEVAAAYSRFVLRMVGAVR